MRERITLHVRAITAPGFDSVNFTETYDAGIERWASVETLDKKKEIFDNVNIPVGSTHSFIIRFDDDISAENVIRWRGDAYEIIKTSDPDGRKQYVELFSRLLGDQNLKANQ